MMPEQEPDGTALILHKGDDCYVFVYDDASRAELLRTLSRFASDPELNFTWYDCAVLNQKIRQENKELHQLLVEDILKGNTACPNPSISPHTKNKKRP